MTTAHHCKFVSGKISILQNYQIQLEEMEDTNILATPAMGTLLIVLQTPVRLLLLKQQVKQYCEYVLQELLFFGSCVKLKSGIALVSKRSCHKKQTRTCHDPDRRHHAGRGQKETECWCECVFECVCTRVRVAVLLYWS
jgi:hypothetical protein